MFIPFWLFLHNELCSLVGYGLSIPPIWGEWRNMVNRDSGYAILIVNPK